MVMIIVWFWHDFCEKIVGYRVISSFSDPTYTSISSFFLNYWRFQDIFRKVSLHCIDFSKNMVKRALWFWHNFCKKRGQKVFRHFQIKLALFFLPIFILSSNFWIWSFYKFTIVYPLILLIFQIIWWLG